MGSNSAGLWAGYSPSSSLTIENCSSVLNNLFSYSDAISFSGGLLTGFVYAQNGGNITIYNSFSKQNEIFSNGTNSSYSGGIIASFSSVGNIFNCNSMNNKISSVSKFKALSGGVCSYQQSGLVTYSNSNYNQITSSSLNVSYSGGIIAILDYQGTFNYGFSANNTLSSSSGANDTGICIALTLGTSSHCNYYQTNSPTILPTNSPNNPTYTPPTNAPTNNPPTNTPPTNGPLNPTYTPTNGPLNPTLSPFTVIPTSSPHRPLSAGVKAAIVICCLILILVKTKPFLFLV